VAAHVRQDILADGTPDAESRRATATRRRNTSGQAARLGSDASSAHRQQDSALASAATIRRFHVAVSMAPVGARHAATA
jgi:hypothetical protein